ncbi:hypothetical protein GGI13_004101 [Coemansia sp. RSA 455]|nr:hypothetical protein GGI13_004101 [Coemansia sp. RSA 455]
MLLYIAVGLLIVAAGAYEIQERAILQPLDHFSESFSTKPQLLQRYFVSNQYYRAGGPILIYSVGERTAQASDLFNGWVGELARETSGLAVLLEQRFYGDSIPDLDLLNDKNGTDVWQYLSVEQMMADIKRFAERVNRMVPEWIAPSRQQRRHDRSKTPVLLIGGSFAGSLMVWTKQRYPDLEALVIASSAPLKVVDGYWEFDRMVARRLPCAKALSRIVREIDDILDRGDVRQIAALKRRFGLEHVASAADFVTALTIQVSSLMQGPTGLQTEELIARYCAQIERRDIDALALMTREYSQYHRIVPVSECPETSDDLAWLWQQCTELGMWQTAPLQNSSIAAEAAWFTRRLRSRRLNIRHYEQQCEKCLPSVRNSRWVAQQKAQFRIFAQRTLDSYTQLQVPSDVVLTAGELDPWLYLAAARNGKHLADNILLIRNASHAEDLLLSTAENDKVNPEILSARSRIIEIIEQWSLKHKQRVRHGSGGHTNWGDSQRHLLVIGSWGLQIGAALSVLCALVVKYAL